MTSPALMIASGAALTSGGARSARVCLRRPQSFVELAGTGLSFFVEIITSRWRSCVATRHATDGRVTIDGLTGRHSCSSNTAARFALCISNSGNRGMQKDMPNTERHIERNILILIFCQRWRAKSRDLCSLLPMGTKVLRPSIRMRRGVVECVEESHA